MDITKREDVSDTFTPIPKKVYELPDSETPVPVRTAKIESSQIVDKERIKYEYKFETIPGHFIKSWGANLSEAKKNAIQTFREIEKGRPISQMTFKSLGKTGNIQGYKPGATGSGVKIRTEKEYEAWKRNERKTIGQYRVATENGIKTFYAVDEAQILRELKSAGIASTSITKTGNKVITPYLEKAIREKGKQSAVEWDSKMYESQIRLGELAPDTVYTPEGAVSGLASKIEILKNGEWIDKSYYDSLTKEYQDNLQSLDIAGFNKLLKIKEMVATQIENTTNIAPIGKIIFPPTRNLLLPTGVAARDSSGLKGIVTLGVAAS